MARRNFSVELDTSDMDRLLNDLAAFVDEMEESVSMEMAETVLLISKQEVPLDESTLLKSGNTEWNREGDRTAEAYYNTDYAAWQHEGGGYRKTKSGKRIFVTITNWQNGRKKKYLEDPAKMNLTRLQDVAANKFGTLLDMVR